MHIRVFVTWLTLVPVIHSTRRHMLFVIINFSLCYGGLFWQLTSWWLLLALPRATHVSLADSIVHCWQVVWDHHVHCWLLAWHNDVHPSIIGTVFSSLQFRTWAAKLSQTCSMDSLNSYNGLCITIYILLEPNIKDAGGNINLINPFDVWYTHGCWLVSIGII